VNLDTAQRIQAAGISSYQRANDFAQVGQWQSLANQTVGEQQAGAGLTQQNLQNAAFNLTTTDQLAVQKLLNERNAAVSGSGGASVSEQGATGLGAVNPNQ
jgi:hypothetical protein